MWFIKCFNSLGGIIHRFSTAKYFYLQNFPKISSKWQAFFDRNSLNHSMNEDFLMFSNMVIYV